MFSDYKEAVVKAYDSRKERGELSLNLERPSPAKLREECLLIIAERYSKTEDDKALRTFFGAHQTIEGYVHTIRSFDIDRFRPLVNFLKKETNETEDKNIELLSWLLDIKPRPFKLEFHKVNYESAKHLLTDFETRNHHEQEYLSEESFKVPKEFGTDSVNLRDRINQKKKLTWNSVLFFGLISVVALALIFRFDWMKKDCMYWENDHYALVDCNIKNPNIHIVAADDIKINHFKKITRLDTLTKDCIGKIWYSKIDNKVDFFTLPGMHPEHQEKSLKIVTQHIYEEYILKKQNK